MNDQKTNDPTKKFYDIKLRNTKYKIYLFLLIIFAYLLRPYYADSIKKVNSMESQMVELDSKIELLNEDIQKAKDINEIIDQWKKKEDSIIACINEWECSEVDNNNILSENINLLRDYLILWKYEPIKMDYDQKLILKNMNEFLFENNIDINIISFALPKLIDHNLNLYELPINLNITISNQDDLLILLENIERKIYSEASVYYLVKSVSYDLSIWPEQSNYEDQTAVISINAYFYK